LDPFRCAFSGAVLTAIGALLDDVSEFVRGQRVHPRGPPSRIEDIVTVREGVCTKSGVQLTRLASGVHPDLGEVGVETRFHSGSDVVG
jgi:hypothetical protein